MARRDNVPLNAHLTNLIVDRVDYVKAGANGESDIVMFKRHKSPTGGAIMPAAAAVKKTADEANAEIQKAIDDAVAVAKEEAKTAHDAFLADLEKYAKGDDAPVLPDDIDPAIAKAVDAALAKERAKNDQLAKEVSDLREENAERIFKAKAKDLPLIGGEDEVAAVLKSVAAGDVKAYAEVEKLLTAANERLKSSGLLVPLGSDQGADLTGDPGGRLDAAAKAMRDADPKLSLADSITKAINEDPTLYRDYQKSLTATS